MSYEGDAPAAETDLVRVRDAWNGWRTAEVPRRMLRDVRWLRPLGAPHALLHAIVPWGPDVITLVAPAGPRPLPHDVAVCVLRTDVLASTYAVLAHEATAAGTPHP